MIEPERYKEFKALGYTQEYHGIPMYKILYSIDRMTNKMQLATSGRIAKMIGKYIEYPITLLKIYWGWNLVSKKPIKTSKDKKKAVEGCSFHWVLTTSGKDKLRRLRQEFGEMIEVDTDFRPPGAVDLNSQEGQNLFSPGPTSRKICESGQN